MIKNRGISHWVDSLDEIKEEGYAPVKAINIYSFFRLKGRTSIITMDNLEPLIPLKYLLHSPKESRYYLKTYRGYTLSDIRDKLYDGTDPFVNSLDGYLHDGNIYLLFDKDGIEAMTAMLTRVWNTKFTDKGKLSYTAYLDLVDAIVRLEEYKDYGRELAGFKTVCKQLEERINELWETAYKSKR